MGVNSLPKTVTRQRRDCDLKPSPSAPESSTLTTRLPSHSNIQPIRSKVGNCYTTWRLKFQTGKTSTFFEYLGQISTSFYNFWCIHMVGTFNNFCNFSVWNGLTSFMHRTSALGASNTFLMNKSVIWFSSFIPLCYFCRFPCILTVIRNIISTSWWLSIQLTGTRK